MPGQDLNDAPTGWVKPQPRRTLAELQDLIATKRLELAQLEREAFDLVNGARLQAIAQARNIMRAHQLTVQDVCGGKANS